MGVCWFTGWPSAIKILRREEQGSGQGDVTMEVEVWKMEAGRRGGPGAKPCAGLWEPKEAGKEFCPGGPRGISSAEAQISHVGLLPFKTVRRHICCFEPPSLWPFVTAARRSWSLVCLLRRERGQTERGEHGSSWLWPHQQPRSGSGPLSPHPRPPTGVKSPDKLPLSPC